MARDIKVVGLCGSLRSGSHTRQALAIALAGAQEMGARIELLELADLPLCTGSDADHPAVLALKAQVASAAGMIWASPEYHGGYSGVLKNALDHLGFEELEGKMVGLLGVAGGALGATSALNGLRVVARTVRAWALPQQVSIAQPWLMFDEHGQIREAQLAERVRDLGRQVTHYAGLHASQRNQA